MENSTLVRRIEPFFLVSAATLYVAYILRIEMARFDNMFDRVVSRPEPIWPEHATYNYLLNTNLPLIAGVFFFLAAWYNFHYLAYPRLTQNNTDSKVWVYGLITIALLVASAFSYNYLKLYVRYRYDDLGNAIGLKAYSTYRKRTVFATTVELGFFILAFELLFQLYAYLSQKIRYDLEKYIRWVGYVLLGGSYILLLVFALESSFPIYSWFHPIRSNFFPLALIIIIYYLQAYCYTYILPKFGNFQSAATSISLVLYILLGLASTITLLIASNSFNARIIISFLFIIYATSFSVAYLRRVMSREKTVLQTQVSIKSAELASLRAQINPHFLFNALNSLYATALKENSEKTADGIQKLGDMMRFMLQENNRERIPLSKEIEYLHNYIQLQRMRLDESHGIEIRVTIQEPDRDIYLAPMMLIPFVENAFKHGISLRKPSWIYVTLTLDATRLYFKVHNSLHARHANDPEEDKSGVGLNNVQKRLELIYPGRHELTIQQSDQDYFVALTLGFW